ncbi:hypothetical protein MMC34_005624 [Xylographa carneopallida]|nr:hypothetical protein [Xylographa carneopallida]
MLLNWLPQILCLLSITRIILAAYPPDDWHDDQPWVGHRCDGQYDKNIADAWPQKSNRFSVLNPMVFDNRWTYIPVPLQFSEENPSRFKGVFYQVSMGLMISVYTTSGEFDIIDARGRLVNEGVAVTSAPIAVPAQTSLALSEASAPPESSAPPASTTAHQWVAPPTDTTRMQLLDAMLGVRRQCIRRGQAGAQWARRNTVLIRIERDTRDLFPRTCTALQQIGAYVVCAAQNGAQGGVSAAYNMRDGACNLYRNGIPIPLTRFHIALPTLSHCAGVLGVGVTGAILYLTAEVYTRPPGASHETQLAIESQLQQLNDKLNVVVQYIGGTMLVPQPGPGPGPGMRRRGATVHLDWSAPELEGGSEAVAFSQS